jgi:hypothetical protein
MRELMRAGYGYDDIAVRLGVAPAAVRDEAARLAAAGELDGLYRPEPEERRPEIEERRRERDRIEAAAREAVWAARAKSALVARGLTRGRLPCPRCGGTVRLALLGPRRRLSARCDTGRCLRSHE